MTFLGAGTKEVGGVAAAAALAAILVVLGWAIVLPLLLSVIEDTGRWWRGR